MDTQLLAELKPRNTELVLGIVAAVGTDVDQFQNVLTDYLKKFRYEVETVRLTDAFKRFDLESKGYPTEHPDPCEQISLRMNAGNFLREETRRGDILALHAAFEIQQARRKRSKETAPCCDARELHALEQAALQRTVYVVRQLKHPDEVNTLRRIYGLGFFLIGVYSTKKERYDFLTDRKGGKPAAVTKLMERDEREDKPFGQKTRDAFALADVFVRVDNTNKANRELDRFLELVFGHPHETPTRDEHRMYLAFASSLRSADLSRQVGAVVTNERGDVIAVGSNDVPCPGGGQYWPGPDDRRDHTRGEDANEIERNKIVVEIMTKIGKQGSEDELLRQGNELLADTRIRELIEFSRAVHAEMDALMACARVGVSPRGGTLYCTTFPCHLCAKHIVDAGIARVVYIEPYAKSLAEQLHNDAIAVEEESEAAKKQAEPSTPGRDQGAGERKNKLAVPERVLFEPFIGVGPRPFPHLFAMRLGNGYPVKRKGDGGKTVAWDPAQANLRVPNIPFSYVEREDLALAPYKNARSE